MAMLARIYVGNDTGPKHMAAAAGVPVVEINPYPHDAVAYRQVSSIFFHPHGVPHVVLRPPAGMPQKTVKTGVAVNAIGTTDVIAAIERLLQQTKVPAKANLQITRANTEAGAAQHFRGFKPHHYSIWNVPTASLYRVWWRTFAAIPDPIRHWALMGLYLLRDPRRLLRRFRNLSRSALRFFLRRFQCCQATGTDSHVTQADRQASRKV